MRYEIKSLGIWSIVKVSFLLHLVFGFVIGLFYAAMMSMFFAMASSITPDDFGDIPFDGRAFGPIMIVLFPIIMSIGGAVFGTLLSAIMAIVYNLVVKMVGGVELELESVTLDALPIKPATPQYVPPTPTWIAPPPPPPSDPDPNPGSPEQA